MKRFLPVVLGLMLASAAFAQMPEKRSEVFIGVGTGPVSFIAEDMASIFLIPVTMGTFRTESEGGGQLMLGYQRRLSRRLSAGVTGTWAGKSETAYVLNQSLGKASVNQYTVVLDGRAHWLSSPLWDLYSGLGLGLAVRSEKSEEDGNSESETTAGLHVTFFGVRLGRDFGGYLEVGGVHNSILTAGLSARF